MNNKIKIIGIGIVTIIIIAVVIIYNANRQSLNNITKMELEDSYKYFYDFTNKEDGSKAYGLTKDRKNGDMASIASTGYGLASLPIGVENGWIDKNEAEDIAIQSLTSLKELERVEGFYYHFYDYNTGEKLPVEVSCIDTTLFLYGALFAGEYFGGETLDLANEIYDEVNWPWFYDDAVGQFYMGYSPQLDGSYEFAGHWDVYAEQLMMLILASGSDTYPVEDAYYGFNRYVGSYNGHEFINSWFGSAFTYQYSQGYIDFRNIEDEDGVNWFNNSTEALIANRDYAINNPYGYSNFNEYEFGMTAGDGPDGYNGYYGAPSSGFGKEGDDQFKNDGTINPYGAIASIVFIPDMAMASAEYMYKTYGEDVYGEYGFVSGYNTDRGWFSDDYIGIDKGITMVMIENYKTGLIWEYIMDNPNIKRGLYNSGFSSVK